MSKTLSYQVISEVLLHLQRLLGDTTVEQFGGNLQQSPKRFFKIAKNIFVSIRTKNEIKHSTRCLYSLISDNLILQCSKHRFTAAAAGLSHKGDKMCQKGLDLDLNESYF